MFYGLGELRLLDLSGNPLTSIGRDDLASVPSLKRLLLNGCQLTRLEAGVFDGKRGGEVILCRLRLVIE